MAATDEYDRLKELTEFDQSKAGVKGLTDSGIQRIPRIFLHPPEHLPNPSDGSHSDYTAQVPVVDLQHIDNTTDRKVIVDEVREASKSWGFFQLVNHGIPIDVLEGMTQGIKRFHEQDKEDKARLYSRDFNRKVKYASNFDLYQSRAANWRDSLTCTLDDSLVTEELPAVCSEAMMDYWEQIVRVADILCEILSEALGVKSDYLKSINCAKVQILAGHYYPPCPQPELTLGTSPHADPSSFTILLQDDLGGLQVLHQNKWVNVIPIHGALVVNIGDFLQLISNDEFKSVKHKVLASREGPRLSVAVFFSPSKDEGRLYGPIKEMLSDVKPPVYRAVSVMDYQIKYYSKGLTADSALTSFKLLN